MTDTPDLSTLPQRMRYAAQVLEEATHWRMENQPGTNAVWTADLLWRNADVREAQDCKAAAEREALVEELADELFDLHAPEGYEGIARQLIESGWRKGEQP